MYGVDPQCANSTEREWSMTRSLLTEFEPTTSRIDHHWSPLSSRDIRKYRKLVFSIPFWTFYALVCVFRSVQSIGPSQKALPPFLTAFCDLLGSITNHCSGKELGLLSRRCDLGKTGTLVAVTKHFYYWTEIRNVYNSGMIQGWEKTCMISEFNFIQASQVPSHVCMSGDLARVTIFFFKDSNASYLNYPNHSWKRHNTILFLKSTITKLTARQGPSENQQGCGKQLRWPVNWPAWLAAGKLWQWRSQSYICLTDSWPSWSKRRF